MCDFEKSAEEVKNFKSRPSDEELLQFYGLYKQATVGDVNTDCPAVIDIKGKAKWNAWNSRKGMSQDDAKKEYCELAQSLAPKYAS